MNIKCKHKSMKDKATLFIIDGVKQIEEITKMEIDDIIYDIDNYELLQKTANVIFKKYDFVNIIERGDIVQFDVITDRNDLKLIWDGNNLINLEYDINIDEYGYVPKQFTIDDFGISFWDNSIDHNYIRWPSKNIKQQIRENIKTNDDHLEYDCIWYSFSS